MEYPEIASLDYLTETNMATITQTQTRTYQPNTRWLALARLWHTLKLKIKVRRCMLISFSLVFAGLGLAFLMTIGVLPASLLLGFIGFGLVSTGGTLALFFCGSI